MGVRLVRYNRPISGNGDGNISQSFDHDELINRDLLNQHPIYAITGLQEALNLLEDSIYDLSILIKDKTDNIQNSLQNQIINNLNAINDLEKRIKSVEDAIKKLQSIKCLDTNTVDLTYDSNIPSLKADVKIWSPKDGKENTNAIQVLATGLYVPKFKSKDSTTIVWSEELKGEPLDAIFNEGLKFSHTGGNWTDHYYPTEENSWYWDNNLQSFVQPRNSSYFNGFITKDFYDCYTHICTIKSTNSDDDANGIVIGHIIDGSGNAHTFTAICDRGGLGGNMLAIWYNYQHPNSQRIAYKSLGSKGGWNSVPNGILFEVKKNKNLVSVCCSRFNSTTLDEAMRINIDLNDYSWGNLFTGTVRYGYCNYSQAYTFYQNVQFTSTYVTTSTETVASVNLSKDATNSLSIKSDGLYSEAFRISANANNAITKQNDGYLVEKFVISPDNYNAIQKKTNGYYVEQTKISSQTDNALQKLSDGTFYVRDYRNIRIVTQNNHGFIVGDFIYYHPQNAYQKAKALDDYDSNIVGMVTKVINANQFEYQWTGFFATNLFSDTNGYIQGMPVYISDTDAGKIVQEQPDISKTVGYPVENAGIIIAIERGIQYNQEASIGDFKVSANNYNVRSDGFIRVVENVNYKKTLVQRLIDTISDGFKAAYIVFDDNAGVIRFVNTQQLYIDNNVSNNMNLFIKAF